LYVAKQAKIHQTENGAKIETPFGNHRSPMIRQDREKMASTFIPAPSR